MASQADNARRANSPWRGRSVSGTRGAPPIKPGVSAGSGSNATRNRKAFKEMSLMERETGLPPSYWEKLFADQRASVRQRFGKRAG